MVDNSAGDAAYLAPCPPSGTHHYRFTVYALSSITGLPSGAGTPEALDAIMSRAITSGTLVATVLIAVAAYGFFFYRSTQERKAQDLLSVAIETIESPIINPQNSATPDPRAKFKTEAERTVAAEKQFKEVQAKFGGTDASDVAGLYIARIASARGDMAAARPPLQKFIAEHPDHLLVGSARYSLYQLRMESGEATQVANELDQELKKPEPSLPLDSLLILLAHSYEVQGNEQKSRDTYRRIVTEYPDSPFALEAQRRVGPA